MVKRHATHFDDDEEDDQPARQQLRLDDDAEDDAEESPSYSTDTCMMLLEPMNKFLETTKSLHCTPSLSTFTLENKITAKSVSFECLPQPPIDNAQFVRAFASTGHAFAIDVRHSYILPLALDFDCSDCSQRPRKQHQDLPIASIKLLCKNVAVEVQKLLPNASDYCVMTRRGHCGFHVYFNASVSIPVYDNLLTHLQASCKFDGLVLDRISCIPLPFSAKHDGQHYTSCVGKVENVHIFPQLPFYDIQNPSIVSEATFGRHDILGQYKMQTSSDGDDDDTVWQEVDMKRSYLVATSGFAESSSGVTTASVLKVPNAEFSSTSHALLAAFINQPFQIQVCESELPDASIFDNQDCDVLPVVCHLISCIARDAYNDHNKTPSHTVKYLMKLLNFNQGGYMFYVLAAFVVYLVGDRGFSSEVVYKVLHSVVGQNKEAARTLSCLEQCADAPIVLRGVFPKLTTWLRRICSIVRESFVPLAVDSVKSAVAKIKSQMRMFRPNKASDFVFVYLGGVYVQKSGSTLLKWHQYDYVETQVLKLWSHHSRDDEKEMRSQLLASLDILSPEFNAYPYFINTKHGIFNTITTRYMTNIDLLYFNTTVNSAFFTTRQLHQCDEWANFVSQKFPQNQMRYLFDLVIVPGLQSWNHALVTTADMDAVLTLCSRFSNHGHLAEAAFDFYQFDDDELDLIRRRLIMSRRQFGYVSMENLKQSTLDAYDEETPVTSGDLFLAKVICILDGYFDKLYSKNFCRRDSVPRTRSSDDLIATFSQSAGVNIDKDCAHALFSICVWCDFDETTVLDFLRTLGMYFSPAAARRFVFLLIGAPKSGKSALVSLLKKFNEGSFKPINSKLVPPKDPSAASPDAIAIASRYAVAISEVSKLDCEYLKLLTGNDALESRGLYMAEGTALKPCAFILTASNGIPSIANAEEAIRERLAPFETLLTFVDKPQDENPLLLYTKHQVKGRRYAEDGVAMWLFWVAYSMFSALKTQETGLLSFSIQNSTSKRLIKDILIKNNIVYKMLDKLHVVIDPQLSIKHADLKSLIENLLSTQQLAKPILPEDLMQKVSSVLLKYRHTGNDGKVVYRGVGRQSDLVPQNNWPPPPKSMTLEELRCMFDQKYATKNESAQNLQRYLHMYRHLYDSTTRIIDPLRN